MRRVGLRRDRCPAGEDLGVDLLDVDRLEQRHPVGGRGEEAGGRVDVGEVGVQRRQRVARDRLVVEVGLDGRLRQVVHDRG